MYNVLQLEMSATIIQYANINFDPKEKAFLAKNFRKKWSTVAIALWTQSFLLDWSEQMFADEISNGDVYYFGENSK